jgi:UDP-N-acetylglucosamine 2-epimerase (non-hydrolysing)
VDVGANMLAGARAEKMLEGTHVMLEKGNAWNNPFGNGFSGETIVKLVAS